MLTDGISNLFQEAPQEVRDAQALKTLVAIISKQIPGAEIMLFGERAMGGMNNPGNGDLLILTAEDLPAVSKWELQEMLMAETMVDGSQGNMLLMQKDKGKTADEYQMLRKRIEAEPVSVG